MQVTLIFTEKTVLQRKSREKDHLCLFRDTKKRLSQPCRFDGQVLVVYGIVCTMNPVLYMFIRNRRNISILLFLTTLFLLFAFPAAAGGTTISASDENTFHILAINDFHGQITSGKTVNGTPVGSAEVVAAYLTDAITRYGENNTIIALNGDTTGGSPAESGLLLDEPTLLFLNTFAKSEEASGSSYPTCRFVATVGNHDFDYGVDELLRKIDGGNGNTTIPHIVDPYPGSGAPFIVSNVQVNETGEDLLSPYIIHNINGVPVAFIGAVTSTTPEIACEDDITSLTFSDEVTAINPVVEELQERGIHAFVVLLHEGGEQDQYGGPTKTAEEGAGEITGRVADIVSRLDEDVDIVLSGHTNKFTNGYIDNAGGRPVLVTQAYYAGKAFADVTVTLDPKTREITSSSAEIVTAFADNAPAVPLNPAVEEIMAEDTKLVAPLIYEVINEAAVNITRDPDANGESTLYDLATDAMRNGQDSDVAFLNEDALREDLEEGPVMTGMLYTIEPFSDQIYTISMTGQEIRDVLEQQWQRNVATDNLLQISGFSCTFDTSLPAGSRITGITIDGSPMDMNATYTVALTSYLVEGGDGYTVFTKGERVANGPIDVDQFIGFLQELPAPLPGLPDGRIKGA